MPHRQQKGPRKSSSPYSYRSYYFSFLFRDSTLDPCGRCGAWICVRQTRRRLVGAGLQQPPACRRPSVRLASGTSCRPDKRAGDGPYREIREGLNPSSRSRRAWLTQLIGSLTKNTSGPTQIPHMIIYAVRGCSRRLCAGRILKGGAETPTGEVRQDHPFSVLGSIGPALRPLASYDFADPAQRDGS